MRTERDYTIERLRPVVERLRQLGIDTPDMPEGEGNEFSDCRACKTSGNGAIGIDGSKIVCPTCLGSGQIVKNAVFDWQRRIMRLYQEVVRRGSQGPI